MKNFNCLIATGSIFGAIGLAAVAVSFATDHWLDTAVDRVAIRLQASGDPAVTDDLPINPVYFTRYRGMFRTCYPGNESAWIVTAPNRVDGWCLSEQGYEITRDSATVNYGADYETRIHLMRAHFALYVIAILALVVANVMTMAACWTSRERIVKLSGALMALGAFFAAGGVAMFHGYEYLENTQISQVGFSAYYQDDAAYKLLVNNSTTSYGYSYILGWVGVGMAFIGAVILLCAAYEFEDDSPDWSRDRKDRYEDEYTLSNHGPARNRPYEDYDQFGDYGSYPGPYPYYDDGYGYGRY